jgi:hypothetical protein
MVRPHRLWAANRQLRCSFPSDVGGVIAPKLFGGQTVARCQPVSVMADRALMMQPND